RDGQAQRGERPERGERGQRPGGEEGRGRGGRPTPLFAALDSDKDGTISKVELKQAMASLKKLDKNNDGQITMEEISGGRGPGGPRGEGEQGERGKGERGPRGEGGGKRPARPAAE
ncbi:EF-hand domain-containing protein, partial [Verrucomicrobia bacterium]|nr:EF-hand domain-containing protein [Verrucomicrobiota bacterium]